MMRLVNRPARFESSGQAMSQTGVGGSATSQTHRLRPRSRRLSPPALASGAPLHPVGADRSVHHVGADTPAMLGDSADSRQPLRLESGLPAGRVVAGPAGNNPTGDHPGQLRSSRRPADSGMASVELAAAVPILVLFAYVLLTALGVAQARMKCADAAREAARAVARGDLNRAETVAAQTAGRPVTVSVSRQADGLLVVSVQSEIRPGGVLPTLHLHESATALPEPDDPLDSSSSGSSDMTDSPERPPDRKGES